MKVEIKNFDVNMLLKNNGIEFDISNNEGNHLGDLVINKTRLTWCKGKTTPKKGIKISWDDFIEWAEKRQS